MAKDQDYINSMQSWIAQRKLSVEDGLGCVEHCKKQIKIHQRMIKLLEDQVEADRAIVGNREKELTEYINS